MASIIKVDQIQTAAGGTPTAADLGINTSGSVINTAFHEWSTVTEIAVTTFTDVTNSTFVYTPVSDNSTLYLTVSASIQIYNDDNSTGGTIRMLVDDTAVTEPVTHYENYLKAGGATQINYYFRHHNQYKITNSSTASKTFKMQAKKYESTDEIITINQASRYYSSYMILEIAG